MVNDIARQARWLITLQMFAAGLMLGAMFAVGSAGRLALPAILLAVGLVATVVWAISSAVYFRRAQARVEAEVVAASTDLVSGGASPIVTAGRLVRRQPAKSTSAFLAGSSVPLPGPTVVFVATALAASGPRRVTGLVPQDFGRRLSPKDPMLLRLHPTATDVAVLDDTVSREALLAVHADPRWTGDDIPSDRSVIGGWSALAVCALVGLGAGLLVDVAAIVVFG